MRLLGTNGIPMDRTSQKTPKDYGEDLNSIHEIRVTICRPNADECGKHSGTQVPRDMIPSTDGKPYAKRSYTDESEEPTPIFMKPFQRHHQRRCRSNLTGLVTLRM